MANAPEGDRSVWFVRVVTTVKGAIVVAILNVPDVVEFTWAEVNAKSSRPVAVDWSTGSAVRGRVVITGVGQVPVDLGGAQGKAQGSGTFSIALGQTATVTLASADGKTTFAVRTVRTAMDAVAQHMTDLLFIRNLRIDVGIESVAVRFDTPQAAVGAMMVSRIQDGRTVAYPMESFGGQQHALSASLLDQDTEYRIRVQALRQDGQGRVTLGSGANNPTRTVRVTTGRRTVEVFFDSIHMDNDSDSGGSGETHFGFSAGGVLDQSVWGQRFFDDDDFGDGGDRDLNLYVERHQAPSWVWAGAFGYDDDGGLFTGLGVVGMKMGFEPPGTHGRETSDTSSADVFDWYDTNQFASGRRVPIELKTGSFGFAFTVTGAIRVVRHPGVAHGLMLGRAPKDRRTLRDGARLLAGMVLNTVGKTGFTRMSRPAPGLVALSTADRPTSDPDRLLLVDVPRDGDPVVVCDGTTTDLLMLDDGRLLRWRLESERPGEPEATDARLDTFAAARIAGVTRVVGVRGERLVTRSLDGPDDWTDLGEAFVGTPALRAGDDWLAVLCRRPDGSVAHARLTATAWGRDDVRWDDLGVAPEGELVVEPATGGGLVIRTEAEDGSGGLLPWVDYPEPVRHAEWFAVTP